MRLLFLLACFAALVAVASAWTKEDHEIFDLVSAVETSEGKGTDFYSWLSVPSTASTTEIAKAYRKKSIQLHPDKNQGVKNAHERFARLGVVSTILRNKESRERYDFFYKNGVPKWRGTGYYYARFRPGLVTVLVFLTILSSGLQFAIQRMNYARDLKRIDWIIEQAKTAAWGTKLVPQQGRKKVKVNLGGNTRSDADGNVVGGKMVDMVVENGDVYMLEEDGGLLPVDSSMAAPSSFVNTWFLSLMTSLFLKASGRKPDGDSARAEVTEDSDDASGGVSDVPGSGTTTPLESTAPGGKGVRAPAAMAGGRRRKAVRRR